jgi:hypothetical protein
VGPESDCREMSPAAFRTAVGEYEDAADTVERDGEELLDGDGTLVRRYTRSLGMIDEE